METGLFENVLFIFMPILKKKKHPKLLEIIYFYFILSFDFKEIDEFEKYLLTFPV